MLDLYNRISFVTDPVFSTGAAIKTNQTGTTFDTTSLNGGTHGVVACINVGTVTDGTHTFTLQDSPDGSTWNAVAAPFVQNQSPSVTSGAGNGSNTAPKIGYLGTNRYLRIVTVENGVTGAVYSVVYVTDFAHNLPAA